jgi:hypothetical protein
MGVLQIIELVLSLAPQGITLTTDILNLIKEVESVIAAIPAANQSAVANVVAKAIVAKT